MDYSYISEQTIVAQCTPTGKGALALLRICGIDAFTCVDSIASLRSNKKLIDVASHTIHYGKIVDASDECVDTVLFFVMRAPHTFTGEDTVEITCHNNPFIIEEIIHRIVLQGGRIANPGEFAQRAVHNEKIDLIQAEGIDELIHAHTYFALKKALAQVEGSFSAWVTDIEKKLVHCLALSEASFEFIDEEYLEFGKQIEVIINDILLTIIQLKKTFNQQQHIKQGIRIAIVGVVNAGKSSFFNTLIGKKRSIVTAIAGTTRDSIEAGIYKNGNYWTLIDTAGLRYTDDIIEQEGIKRSFNEAALADILLVVIDGSRLLNTQEIDFYNQLSDNYGHKIIFINNKADLQTYTHIFSSTSLSFSFLMPEYSIPIEDAIQRKIDILLASAQSPFLLNKRHFNVLMELEDNIIKIIPFFNNTFLPYELLSVHINQLLAQFAQLTGKSISDAAMDEVFRSFCVGK